MIGGLRIPIGATVLGIGIDVVAIDRFVAALDRTPGLRDRLFAIPEQLTATGARRSAASLAARFAVKEAVAKVLGVPAGLEWHHASVVSQPSGRPALVVTDTVADFAARLGIVSWQLSISHDAGIAAAVVLAIGA